MSSSNSQSAGYTQDAQYATAAQQQQYQQYYSTAQTGTDAWNQQQQQHQVDPLENAMITQEALLNLLRLGSPGREIEVDPAVLLLVSRCADEFVENVGEVSGALAKHRQSAAIESKDVVMAVQKQYGFNIPVSFGDTRSALATPHFSHAARRLQRAYHSKKRGGSVYTSGSSSVVSSLDDNEKVEKDKMSHGEAMTPSGTFITQRNPSNMVPGGGSSSSSALQGRR